MPFKHLFYLFILCALSSCHVGRFFIYNFADKNDHKKFPSASFKAQKEPFTFFDSNENTLNTPEKITLKGKEYDFETFLEKSKTLGFMVIRNDSILYENYFKNLDKTKPHPSFSVAKSYVSALLGIAIDEGYIKSTDEEIMKYIPELGNDFKGVTIEHVLNMRSGVKFDEGYFNPFGDVAKYYYGRNLNKYIRKLTVESEPDMGFQYRSVNTQLLATIIATATQRPFQDYFYEKLWAPLHMEYDASWSLDSKKNNTPKAFCCLNATMRDFAKFGKLYLNNGNYNGKQIVPVKWVKKTLDASQALKNKNKYAYQWWRISHLEPINQQEPTKDDVMVVRNNRKYISHLDNDYYAQGILGQFIYINPDKNMVIVRLGSNYGKVWWKDFFQKISKQN